MRLLLLLLVVVSALPAAAAESDPFWAWRAPPKDSTRVLDRAGLTGADGPTHHGMFDVGYMRLLPNMVVMCPGDAFDADSHTAAGSLSMACGLQP